MEGTVTKSTGSWYEVRSANAQSISCRVRGKMRMHGIVATNPVAVGDKVIYQLENDNQGIITKILPRENYLIRRSTKKSKQAHILAANLDQAVLIATIAFPKTSLGFIDRFLVAAESFRIPQLLVFNKIDRWNDESREFAQEMTDIYQSIGVECILVSALEKTNMELLRTKLRGKLSLIAGHSGVGKSTVLNSLSPDIDQKTAEVSTFANKGIHTTTFAEMFALDPDTFVIDTPGIKELGLIDIHDEEISHFFPEMRDLFGQCKFYNCTHTHEPGCAVVEAVENGQIALSRYESYIGMVYEEETHR